MGAAMGLLLWESPGLGLGLGFSFWEQDTWDKRGLGAAKHQRGLWLTLFHKPGVISVPRPRERVRQGSFYSGDSKVHPHQEFKTVCFWVSFPSCAKCGQCSTAVRRDMWPIEIYKLNSATLFTLWEGEWVLEQPEQHPKARNEGELPATSPSKLSSKGKLTWGASSRPTT